MDKLKKILFISIAIIFLLGFLNLGLNVWAKSKLPKLINNENNTDYDIAYKDIDLSLRNLKIALYDIQISPKKSLENSSKKIGVYAAIDKIEVNDFDIWSVLFGKKIKANTLLLSKPSIILYKNDLNAVNNYNSISSKLFKPFEQTIIVSNLLINQGNFKILTLKNSVEVVKAHNFNFKLEGIVLNEKTLSEKIPILYQNYSLLCDSIYYNENDIYEIKGHEIKTTKNSFQIKNFALRPKYSRREIIQKLPKEKDIFTIFADSISINKMDWGFKDDNFYFKTNSVVLNHVNANIYRGKMPADDLSKKELYSKLLRDLKTDIKVDSLLINNSFLTYEEEKTFEKGPGKLFFSNFNFLAQNIESGYKKSTLPDVKIKINCDFMKTSPLKVDWSFNVLDITEGFKIAGSIKKFNTYELGDFTKPYMNLKIKGELDEVYFNFAGNDQVNKGKFSLKYDDLKVEIYQNDKRLKKNKFLSAIGNLFVKNDSDEELKTTTIEVERNPEKSFYNFLWISLADGLSQILL